MMHLNETERESENGGSCGAVPRGRPLPKLGKQEKDRITISHMSGQQNGFSNEQKSRQLC